MQPSSQVFSNQHPVISAPLLSAFHSFARLGLLPLITGLLITAHSPAQAVPPNIVFILVDDLGWTDLGCYGSQFYETPNLDHLATEGTKFTQAYAACPVCSPTRASIMTGRYPQRTGITDYIGAAQPDKWNRNTILKPAPYATQLAHEEVTLAEMLKTKGYATFFAGKWHLGPEGFWPETQGFDVNKGGIDRGGPYGGKKYFSPYDNPRLPDGPDGEHLPDRLATETVKFIEEHKDKPFFTYLSFYSVHTPLMSREDLRQKYEAKKKQLGLEDQWGVEDFREVRLVQEHTTYAGMVEAMDAAVGKVLAKLKELGLDKNSVVFVTSDNGGLSTSEGHPTSNLPLRGGKGWLYEGGVREIFLSRWPGVTQPGTVNDSIVISPDFMTTIAEITGAKKPATQLDGVSFVPALKGQTTTRGPIFWHYPHYGNQGGFPGGAVRDGDWKLIEDYEDGSLRLYDLAHDIGEMNNLADAQPERAKALQAKLAAWRKDVGANMPAKNTTYDASKPNGREAKRVAAAKPKAKGK